MSELVNEDRSADNGDLLNEALDSKVYVRVRAEKDLNQVHQLWQRVRELLGEEPI